jgi:succinate dehydrogenase/fumarate reductase flavoprotein subunit
MTMHNHFDVIVIGGGHAGRVATLAIRPIAARRASEAGAEDRATWRGQDGRA